MHGGRIRIPESMHAEHEEIHEELVRATKLQGRVGDAARHLEAVARAERNAGVEKLAQKLQLHAKSEEELFYPAALLVGDVVRGRK
jgi:hypothetical protein